jgi:hypothetical protein
MNEAEIQVQIVGAELGWKKMRLHLNLRHADAFSNIGGQLYLGRSAKKDDAVMQAYHVHLHKMGIFDHEHQ